MSSGYWHRPVVDIVELRKRAARNMQDLASGAMRRRNEATAKENKARAQAAVAERRLKRIDIRNARAAKRLKVREVNDLHKHFRDVERDPNPLGYAEGMTDADKQGMLEEIDARIMELNGEIESLNTELYYAEKTLRSM